jgi:hypothetical protein
MNEIKMLFGRVVLFLAVCAGAGGAQAQVFNYNPGGYGTAGDVLVCFRYVNPTTSALGNYELVVDCGSVATFTNMTAGQTKAITTFYSPSLLSYVGTNNIYWSALACYSSADGKSSAVWMTRPRSDMNTQSAPWPCKNTSAENLAGGQIDTIGNDAMYISYVNNTPAQSATYLVEHQNSAAGSSDFWSYSTMMGANQDLAGNFWGDVSGNKILEQGTPSNFTTAGQPVRADFYQLLSTNMIANPTNNQAGKYLGYFEFATNGVMTYTAGPSPVVLTAPRIVSFTRNGTTNTVYFTTIGGGTFNYTLRGTNSAGLSAAKTSWPAIGSSIAGNGLTNSLVEITTSDPRYYIITAQ